MNFTKMQGLGNDFVVVDGPADPSREEIVSWCDRRRGVGADGVLEVSPVDSDRVRMRYWNADGGEVEMCGNGLRCVARYAVERGFVGGPGFLVDTAVGALPVHINEDDTVRVLLGKPSGGEVIEVAGMTMYTVEVGNPHAIQWVDDPDSAPVGSAGPRIETAAPFEHGTNAEFAALTAPDEITLRVWERGVGETLACGTGAAATAYLANQQGLVGNEVLLRLRGGNLNVILDAEGAWIEGPAEFVFSGSLY